VVKSPALRHTTIHASSSGSNTFIFTLARCGIGSSGLNLV